MRFFRIFTVGLFLLSGIFMNLPPCTVMATPGSKTVLKGTRKTSKRSGKTTNPASGKKQSTQISPVNAETQEEKSVQSKEVTDPANEKKESPQISTAEKPKAPSVSAVDYDKMINEQLYQFLQRDLAKNLAALPLEPIVTIALSNLPDGLKKVFFVGDKIYSGFSTLAQLWISRR